ncbi:MAG: hypothetical protein JNM00_08170, partial [Flavobacteriales bacterium]|nr:hypothetical protein [Flavobacteriales bacterium]
MKHFYLRSAIARLCAVFCVGTLVQTGLFAQVALYSFSQTAGSYTPITGGTVVAAQTGSSGAASIDDVIYNLPNGTIPFSYNFNGTTYTGLNISSNGFVTFGATAPGTTNYNPISSTATYNSTIAAFARDLQGGFVTTGNVSSGSAVITGVTNTTYVTVGSGISGTGIPTGATVLSKTATDITISAAATSTAAATAVFVWNGEIRYETLGSAPNRVFVIQWANAKRFGTAATAQNGHISFQIRLYETTNVAEVVYANALGNATNITPAVGLRGSANTDFNDRTGA